MLLISRTLKNFAPTPGILIGLAKQSDAGEIEALKNFAYNTVKEFRAKPTSFCASAST